MGQNHSRTHWEVDKVNSLKSDLMGYCTHLPLFVGPVCNSLDDCRLDSLGETCVSLNTAVFGS